MLGNSVKAQLLNPLNNYFNPLFYFEEDMKLFFRMFQIEGKKETLIKIEDVSKTTVSINKIHVNT